MGVLKIPNNATNLKAVLQASSASAVKVAGGWTLVPAICAASGSFSVELGKGEGVNGLHLYAGAMPTKEELTVYDGLSGIVTKDALPRSADLLCVFKCFKTSIDIGDPSVLSISLKAATAIKSGMASWFMLFCSAGSTGVQVIVGTAGTSGCDLNMQAASISEGSLYKPQKVCLPIPSKFSW